MTGELGTSPLQSDLWAGSVTSDTGSGTVVTCNAPGLYMICTGLCLVGSVGHNLQGKPNATNTLNNLFMFQFWRLCMNCFDLLRQNWMKLKLGITTQVHMTLEGQGIMMSNDQAGHFPTNGRNSPTWGNFTLCRRKYILPRREKMSMFASVFTVAEKSHFDNSSTFKTNQYSIYVCLYQHPKWLQLVRISLQRFITRTFAMGCAPFWK